MKQVKVLKEMVLAATIGVGFFSSTSVSAAGVEHLKVEQKQAQIEGHMI
ncbi:hypothetical protein [Bacillus toyonensis]|nr:hypothetical protein [Bacillus toyonensis]